MDTFITLIFKDSILFVATLVVAATALILAWALKTLKDQKEDSFEITDDDMPQPEQEPESSGLFEARLQEINTQLAELSLRLAELDKTIKENAAKQPMDQTIQVANMVTPDMLERSVQRIEARLESIAAERQVSPAPASGIAPDAHDAITRLEGKLEGIHRLLILLTDSGGSEQK